MKKIILVFGTRPEAIKMCPLVLELKKSPRLEVKVCVTGQHKEMLEQVLDIFGVVPDFDLAIMKQGQDLTDVNVAVLLGMRDILKKEKPDVVLVHGDTSTAYAASLAAFYQQIPTGLKKFGAMLGDFVEVGCNSVLNPGTVIGPHSNIYPTSCVRGVVPANSIWKTGGVVVAKHD